MVLYIHVIEMSGSSSSLGKYGSVFDGKSFQGKKKSTIDQEWDYLYIYQYMVYQPKILVLQFPTFT